MAGSKESQAADGGQRLFLDPKALAHGIEILVRQVLEAELERHIGAKRYERSSKRSVYRNGTKPRTMNTCVGKLEFAVPQVRDSSFHPSIFERYQRSDRALIVAIQEMYVQGVSTRRVSEVMQEMAGFELSAATVSRAAAELDEAVERWRNRPLKGCAYPYLVIDARYERVRKQGRVVSQAVLVVAGISELGQREILGFHVGDSESEASWGELFMDLKRRGLHGVDLVTSDAHAGIRAALARHFQGVEWQRCRVHLMRELLRKVSWRDAKELAKDLRSIFAGDSREQCKKVAEEIAEKWQSKAPKMSKALLEGIEDCLAVWRLSPEHRRRLHSTNMLERLMRSLRQRSRVVSIWPDEASLVRLMGSVLMEIDEKWSVEPSRYLTF